MKRLFLLTFLLSGVSTSWPQPIPNYYTHTNFLMAPPAAYEDGLVGFANPANLSLLHRHELRFIWSTAGRDAFSLRNWGVFAGAHRFGLAVQRQKLGSFAATDFKISAALGSRSLSYGLAYGWSSGDLSALGRAKLITAGSIYRPSKFISIGLIGNFSLQGNDWEGIAEVGLRPFGSSRVTLFADAAIQKDVRVDDAPWSAGATWQFAKGLHLVGRYFRSNAFTLGLQVNFGRTGLAAQGHFDSDNDHALNTYMVRTGGTKASFFPTLLGKGKHYLPVSLRGRVEYLKYRFLDGGKRFFEILSDIEAAIDDPRVQAIALNLSSMRVRPEHAWEIRKALQEAQAAGKKVIVFMDRAGMTTYHLASVADRVVLDPQGSVVLQGYALGRTYLKGTFEKMGLGFDEWRFFKYKSANETFSRDSMSDADREQLQEFVDDWYDLTRSEVCRARNFRSQEFDRIIDEGGYFSPNEALEVGLVDTLARWSTIDGIVAEVNGRSLRGLSTKRLLANDLPKEDWGRSSKIALVYGLGLCAMDTGIRARWLEQVFLALGRSRSVKAVVFRVDSPGGDGMASDLVAEAIRKCRETKPVIVSQGQVAGSGGYWISMYGDSIVAGPNTTMGSIGVIGGWVYDKGLSDKLGMTSDLVQRGKHADLGRGVNLPFLNLQVPARNLTADERAKAEANVRLLYDEFVRKVAEGRGMTEKRVREVAEGRIYSGAKGKEIGLVDELGGLQTAIEMAKRKAGMQPGEEFEVIEIPSSKGLIDIRGKLLPSPIEIQSDPAIEFIRLMVDRAGEAVPIMIPGTYPDSR
ncbi:S49 family peptidase [bacterium]|nr:S49 family peptidase [bacterium]